MPTHEKKGISIYNDRAKCYVLPFFSLLVIGTPFNWVSLNQHQRNYNSQSELGKIAQRANEDSQ